MLLMLLILLMLFMIVGESGVSADTIELSLHLLPGSPWWLRVLKEVEGSLGLL